MGWSHRLISEKEAMAPGRSEDTWTEGCSGKVGKRDGTTLRLCRRPGEAETCAMVPETEPGAPH